MRTDFLFATPSFLSGASRALDLGCTFNRYNSSATPNEADLRAMLSDYLIAYEELVNGRRSAQRAFLGVLNGSTSQEARTSGEAA